MADLTPAVDSRRAIQIAVGGALGAVTRWAVADLLGSAGGSFPWAVLAVNVVGSALLGWALVEARHRPPRASLLIDGVGTGFCGGLTTFSTFAVDSAALARSGDTATATLFLVATVVCGLAAASLAVTFTRRSAGVAP